MQLGAATLAPRCREAAQRVGERGERLAEPLPPSRPRQQGLPTAGGAVAALGAGPPPLLGWRLRKRSALLRPRGLRASGGTVAVAVPQGPEHAAPDKRGQLSRVRQASPLRCIGPEVQRPRPPPPSQPAPQTVGPQRTEATVKGPGGAGADHGPPLPPEPAGRGAAGQPGPSGAQAARAQADVGQDGAHRLAAQGTGDARWEARPGGYGPTGRGRVTLPASLPRALWMR